MSLVTVLILGALMGLIPAVIARSKGRSFAGWWFFGAMLFIVALPCAILLRPDQAALDRRAVQGGDMKKCWACAEMVRREAIRCRFCGADLAAGAPAAVSPSPAAPSAQIVQFQTPQATLAAPARSGAPAALAAPERNGAKAAVFFVAVLFMLAVIMSVLSETSRMGTMTTHLSPTGVPTANS